MLRIGAPGSPALILNIALRISQSPALILKVTPRIGKFSSPPAAAVVRSSMNTVRLLVLEIETGESTSLISNLG